MCIRDRGFIRDDAPLEMYRIGAEHGVCYFIVPGNRVESLRCYHHLLTELMDKPCFCMPGIGRQGGSITTAFEALPETPAYAIVGSAIYKSQSVTEAARKLGREALQFG